MKKGDEWVKLSQCLTLWELCYIEDALNGYSPHDLSEFEKENLKDLKETISAARGWRKNMGKCDRKER